MPPSKKKQKKSNELPDGPKAGRRGQAGLGGWWISLDEAKEKSVAEQEWWTHPGRDGFIFNPRRHGFRNGSPSRFKPVWLFENGDMYLGNWKKNFEGQCVENGFGITYNNFPAKYQGNIYMGEWENGTMHGEGVSFWLESSKTWTKNRFAGSPIKKHANGGRSHGVPFRYEGGYHKGLRLDQQAVVTLKNGSTRTGPWKDGNPIDGWYSHTFSAAVPRRASASVGPRIAVKEEPNSAPTEFIDISDSEKPNSEPTECIDISNSGAKLPAATAVTAKQHDNKTRNSGGDNGAALDNAQTEKYHRLGQIRDWITNDVIGSNPSSATMEQYARGFYEKGFESIEMIKVYLKDRHVQSFNWISELHKEIFLERIEGGW